MKTLAWMTLQAAIVAAVVVVQVDVGHQLGKTPDYGTAFVFGIFAAFLVTAAIVIVRDKILAKGFGRGAGPSTGIDLDTRATTGIPAIGSGNGETGSEGQSLATPTRSGGDGPKLIGSRWVS